MHVQHVRPLSREGSLSCRTCSDTGPRFYCFSLVTFCDKQDILNTYSTPNQYGTSNTGPVISGLSISKGSPVWFFVCFVCLYDWGLSSHSRLFHWYWDITIASEWLQILTYSRHSWPLSSEGSLARHTFCDTGHPFIIVISDRGPVTLAPIAERLAVELSLPVVTTYRVCRGLDSNTQPSVVPTF